MTVAPWESRDAHPFHAQHHLAKKQDDFGRWHHEMSKFERQVAAAIMIQVRAFRLSAAVKVALFL